MAEKEFDHIEMKAFELLKEGKGEIIDREKEFSVRLGTEARDELLDLLMRPYSLLLPHAKNPSEVIPPDDQEIIGKLFEDLDGNEYISAKFNYRHISRLGGLVYAEILGSRGRRGVPLSFDRKPYDTHVHGSAFLDLTESFMMAGGPDVKPFRLAVSKLMEPS